MPMTEGTKIAETRSASFCMGALLRWASPTSLTMRASTVSLPTLVCDAEQMPFPDQYFDRVSVAFGLRNMTHKDAALKEMCRVLKPQGRLLVLEFSRVAKPLQKAYDWYSFNVLPKLGQWVAGDPDSYRYLAESIRMHPDQAGLKTLMQECGLGHVDIHNLSAGLVALHVAIRC